MWGISPPSILWAAYKIRTLIIYLRVVHFKRTYGIHHCYILKVLYAYSRYSYMWYSTAAQHIQIISIRVTCALNKCTHTVCVCVCVCRSLGCGRQEKVVYRVEQSVYFQGRAAKETRLQAHTLTTTYNYISIHLI